MRRSLLVAALPGAPVAVAQDGAVAGTGVGRNPCIDAIPDSALRRVAVYLTARG
jgi:hypothetical protein